MSNQISKWEMREKLDALKSEKGGWTRANIESLGVTWPPQRGWQRRLIDECLHDHEIEENNRLEVARDERSGK